MVNLKFGAFPFTFTFTFTLCLLLTSCVCDPCTIQDTTATCESNEDFKSLQNATNIKKLIVRSSELKRINKDDFALLVNLEEIDLSNSGLEEIDENAFAGLPHLHKINLAGNTKLKIPNDASFITSNTLTCLNLSHTVVDELDKTFTQLPQLQNLDLSGTNVKDFSPLEHLEHLTKLVVTKTNESKDLCNILSIKGIIEKDANETETPLDCETAKNVTEAKTEHGKTEGQTKEEKTEVGKTKEEKTEVGTAEVRKTDEGKTEEEKTEEEKTEEGKTEEGKKEGEATTVAAKTNETIKIAEAVTIAAKTEDTTTTIETSKIAETTAAAKKIEASTLAETTTVPTKVETPDVNKNETKEITKKKGDTPKKVDEEASASEKKEIIKNSEQKESEKPDVRAVVTSSPTEYVVETEVTQEPIIKNEEGDTKPEEKGNRKANIVAPPKPKDENPNVILEASDDAILPSTSNTSQSNGVNIVLGIILCVMIVGAIGFGYKYWKNRRSGYTHANTQDNDDEDKELQTIVAHRIDPDQN